MVNDFTCCTPFHSTVVPTGSLMPSASASAVVKSGSSLITFTRDRRTRPAVMASSTAAGGAVVAAAHAGLARR